MRNVIVKTDYEQLNELFEDILGKDFEINELNAKEKIKEIYYDRALKIRKIYNLRDEIEEHHSNGVQIFDKSEDCKLFCNTMCNAEILLERQLEKTIMENIRLVINLIIDDNILEILEEDMPNLIEINNIMNEIELEQDDFRCDLSDISEKILNIMEKEYIEDINKEELFTMINNSLKEFVNKEKIKELYKEWKIKYNKEAQESIERFIEK